MEWHARWGRTNKGVRERERERAHGREEKMASALVVVAGEARSWCWLGVDAGHAVSRPCRCSEREEEEVARAVGAGLASLARPVGWRRPTSEQPPFLF
jgi:hypothetical protein